MKVKWEGRKVRRERGVIEVGVVDEVGREGGGRRLGKIVNKDKMRRRRSWVDVVKDMGGE